jgi:Protein of unknown function (DUF1036)
MSTVPTSFSLTCLSRKAVASGVNPPLRAQPSYHRFDLWRRKLEGRWLSQGWHNIKPRECGSTILGIFKNTFYYYYAHTESLTWSGEGRNEGYFCTSNKAFFYVNNDTNCTGYTFKRLEVGDADQFTQRLIETKNDPKQTALNGHGEITKGSDAFTKCWMINIATSKQRDILECYDKTASFASLAMPKWAFVPSAVI